MRKIFTLIVLIAVSLSSRSQLLTDQFSYTPSATLGLSAQSSGLWSIVNTGDSILVTAGSLTYPGLAASAGNKVAFDGAGTDYYITYAAQTAGSVYNSFILNVSSLGSLNTTGSYFAGVQQTGSTTSFGSAVWLRASTTAGKYNIGVSTRSNSTVSWLATDLTPGTSYFVVTAYDIIGTVGTDDVSRIWLNTAAIGAAEPAADATAAAGTDFAAAGVGGFFLRQAAATTTPFVEMDELRVGTTWASVTPSGTATPTLTAGTLTGFGNVCINTTAGPNSFTLTGSNLTNAAITVGALTGYTYSTTPAGIYTTSLNLTQPGGTYNQTIYVKFTPVAVTAYNGNIPVAGGGVASFNVSVTGSGVNSIPTLTGGTATGITSSGATVPGTITSTGCTTITAYGIEYSTVNNFANGAGTQVPSSNLAANNFSSALSGLAASTVYYFHAYAANGGGTGYSTQGTFTTAGPSTLTATGLTPFGTVCINTTAGPNSFTITGTGLTAANVTVGALTGYTYSTTPAGAYTASLSLSQTGGAYSQIIYVKFTPVAVTNYNGNIPVGGGGATTINVPASGSGINTQATVTTGATSSVTSNSATAAGSISANGCSAVTAYGIEYSTTNGFTPGTGTQTASTNLTGGNYTSALGGLAASTTYYYYAYATNGGGTAYGTIMSFTTPAAAVPTLSPSALAAFGNVCINTTAGPNSFTITGTSLTAANVTVGALTGYTYSTSAGGVYTTTLSLTQPGGSYNQTIYVKFTPTAVTTYNGNIPVGGGGATTANVAASGTGINTAATVTSGAASAVTSTSATVAGTIPSTGCSPLTAYGIEYSTTNGFANGTGTAVASANLAGVNFSSALAGLAPSTVYYFHAYATTSAGTVYGTQGTFTTLTPTITVSALTAFGATCINTTVGPNSFTITGTNLTTANVNVAALTGYTYSATAAGTYTATLSLTQTGGAYSQAIFVKFTPTLVQSYNGNIAVNGGGVAAAVNAAASGSGINTAPTVTSAAATAITQSTATVAGTIPATGCSAVTAYGIEWSTTSGFANGTGTAVASTNLTGVNFSSNLTGLAVNTTYYYHAYATNGAGTVYGAQQSFTTAPAILTATAVTAFGNVCINTTAGPNSFTISSTLVSAADINVAALAGYTYSTTATGTYSITLSLTHAAGAYSQQIFVKLTPTVVASYNGNIAVTGGGSATTLNVAVTGASVNTGATVVTNDATDVTRNSATVGGTLTAGGCNPATQYGIEYSGISGFTPGIGMSVPVPTANATGDFSITLTGLVPASVYYYRAYAVSATGKTYGAEKMFITPGVTNLGEFIIYSNPIARGGVLRYSIGGILPAHYVASIVNMQGQVVYTEGVIVTGIFIDGKINMPGKLPSGVYSMVLRNINTNDTYHKSFLLK